MFFNHIWAILGHVSRTIFDTSKWSIPIKFDFNLPKGFKGDVSKSWMMPVIGILLVKP